MNRGVGMESLCRVARKQDGGSNGRIRNYTVITRQGVSFSKHLPFVLGHYPDQQDCQDWPEHEHILGSCSGLFIVAIGGPVLQRSCYASDTLRVTAFSDSSDTG